MAWLLAACSQAETIEFVVDRVDGGVFIKNSGATPSIIDGYTIFSPSDALIISGWTPIAGNYDASGDQSVDSTSDWFVIGTPTATTVSEASLTEESGSLDPGQVVSLGLFFDLAKLEGLAVTVSAGNQTIVVAGDYRNLQADYNGDLVVDHGDYDVFQMTYGSTGAGLAADGNGDGVVDAADYTVWRDSPELSLASMPAITAPGLSLPGFVEAAPGGVVTIPEPAAVLLAAQLLACCLRRRAR
ncbi:hypothetical protein [Botrimarina mediterranea]|uniref:hypothetical protein n=1 Tax=Botrimarina mediterranea TaxID=2528022 RepID=UPI0011A0DC87|nr:hypothetical protein [Botrimarina mediterranea]